MIVHERGRGVLTDKKGVTLVFCICLYSWTFSVEWIPGHQGERDGYARGADEAEGWGAAVLHITKAQSEWFQHTTELMYGFLILQNGLLPKMGHSSVCWYYQILSADCRTHSILLPIYTYCWDILQKCSKSNHRGQWQSQPWVTVTTMWATYWMMMMSRWGVIHS